ncbi:ABC transporter substrate-binding protein [Marinovum sp.]|uniref:ABC transporter substrate-binding protein n=1 Tax=Marinovum sp. TaxID=2024839 RepID=UPI002B278831|nr:ABC transporter substrate-binding protein [Marinovum sp.]
MLRTKFTGVSLAALVALAGPAFGQEYSQAPDLQAAVDAGSLPPVVERLPENPMVVTPIESVGSYGGTWRSALKGTYDTGWIRRTVGYQPLVAYDYEWTEVVPNVAERFEVNDEATEFTFYLREGHKWSDGEPFTAEDLLFALNVMKSPAYAGRKPAFEWDKMTGEVIDPLTFKVTLSDPNGLFLERLASVEGQFIVNAAKHYCGKYFPDVDPAATDNAKAEGFDSWTQAMEQSCFFNFVDEDRPLLFAWRQTTPYDGLNQLIEFERNPYFFKVDTEGQQLPYIDKVQMVQTENVEDIVLKVVNGEIDFSNRHFATVTNKPVIYDGQESGGYTLKATTDARMNHAIFQLNLTHDDPEKRKLYNEKDFRKALSLAMDREEIIDVVFAGQGEPYQAAPRPSSQFYDETLAKQFTEYDPDTANELLDGLGLTERNSDGIRLGYDGEPIRIQLFSPSDQTEFNDIAQLVVEHWKEIGIDLDARNAERSLVYERVQNNTHDMHVWWGDGGMNDAILDPRFYFPFNLESAFAEKWSQYFLNTGSTLAEAPPEEVQKQMDLYIDLIASPDKEEQKEIFGEILDIAAEQFYVIGTVLPADGYVVANEKLGNVPEGQVYTWVYPQPGPMETSQLYYKK